MITAVKQKTFSVMAKVLDVRRLTPSTFVLRFERRFDFEPGQHIRVGLEGEDRLREYSIYSSPNDDAMEILVKEVLGGLVSPEICHCKPGDDLIVEGPFGCFRLKPEARSTSRFVFVATGTGIAPFHSMISTYAGLDYQLLHGVSYLNELYESDEYSPGRRIACVSRESGGDFCGRLTEFLKQYDIGPDQLFYFCGNSDMIFDAFQILTERGIERERMFAEIYF